MNQRVRVFVPINSLALLVIDALLIAVSFASAPFLIDEIAPASLDPVTFLFYDSGFTRIHVAVLTILIGIHFQNLYSNILIRSRLWLFQQLCFVLGTAFIFQAVLAYFVPGLRVPVRVMVVGSLLAIAAVYVSRLFYSSRFLQIPRWDRILLVGSSPFFKELSAYVEAYPEAGLFIAGCVGAPHLDHGVEKCLGPAECLIEIVEAVCPRRIIVGNVEASALLNEQLLALRFSGYKVERAEDAYERILGRIHIDRLGPSEILYGRNFAPNPQQLLVQSMWTTAAAAIALIVLSPLLALAAALSRLAFAGPILDRQPRVGLGGGVFRLCRFRRPEAARIPVLARVIAPLRDLPLLFNVLKGELAIVGPAPDRLEFVDVLSREIPFYRHRQNVRPGITGWAQIHGANPAADTIRQLERDLYYVKNMSLRLDTFILLQTLKMLALAVFDGSSEPVRETVPTVTAGGVRD
jgi:lipopolysaccharide/colanic/teichoic acid biosynthesis glycosyltransferase